MRPRFVNPVRSRRFGAPAALTAAVAAVAVLAGGGVSPDPAAATTPVPPGARSFTPTSGPAEGGNEVVLTGYSMDLVEVKFGDTTAARVPGSSTGSSITVIAPPGRTGTTVEVTTHAFGFTSRPGKYTYDGRTRYPVQASPSGGRRSGGNTVTITGENIDFRTIQAVRFGGQFAALGPATAASVDVTVPAGTAGADVGLTVVTADGEVEGQATDRYQYAWSDSEPAVAQLEPATGYASGSEFATITGTALRGAVEVTVDGSPVDFSEGRDADMPVDAARLVFMTKPHAAATVDVRVTTQMGTSANTAADDFTFLPVPGPPEITRLFPNKAFEGERREIAVEGRNLVKLTTAYFGSVRAPWWNHGSGTSAAIAAPMGQGVGTVDVRVDALGGTNDTSGPGDDFTYVPRSPVVVSPARGSASGYTEVTLSNEAFAFEYVDNVTFGGKRATIVEQDNTKIVVRTPAGVAGTTVPIGLNNYTTQRNAMGETFTYTDPPAPEPAEVAGLTPSSGPMAGGTGVSIWGYNLGNVTAVRFGSVAVASEDITQISDFELLVKAPGAVAPGKVDVVVQTIGTVGVPSDGVLDDFTYVAPPPPLLLPTISRLSPNNGMAGFGGLTTISGAQLKNVKAVRFGTKTAAFIVVGAKIIVFAPPQPKGTYPVTVTTSAGTSAVSSRSLYTYKSLI